LRDLDFVCSIFPILQERYRQDATTLSGGEQQMCATGRGLTSKPKLLMIDELSFGLQFRFQGSFEERSMILSPTSLRPPLANKTGWPTLAK
jgi:branched-chain amino acid transport system ATP-binding protein